MQRYYICQSTKRQTYNTSLYISLPILENIWKELSIDFVLSLPCTQKGEDFIFDVIDMFSKIMCFIPYKKINDPFIIAQL